MKTEPFLLFYPDESTALEAMRLKNRAHRNGDKAVFVVIEGPENNWAVVDLATAIEMEMPYKWEV